MCPFPRFRNPDFLGLAPPGADTSRPPSPLNNSPHRPGAVKVPRDEARAAVALTAGPGAVPFASIGDGGRLPAASPVPLTLGTWLFPLWPLAF